MAVGFNGCCNYADLLGYDTTYIRQVISNWVKTGTFPGKGLVKCV